MKDKVEIEVELEKEDGEMLEEIPDGQYTVSLKGIEICGDYVNLNLERMEKVS